VLPHSARAARRALMGLALQKVLLGEDRRS